MTLLLMLGLATTSVASARANETLVEEVAATDLLTRLETGKTTSEALVRSYLQRIVRLDRAGPALHSVIIVNPDAIAQARKLDVQRKLGKIMGPLHGLPILIKDNIESADLMPTTAGSLALKDNITGRDAPAIARLRAAGAIVLGKTNLSEWANMRDFNSLGGWSGMGGLTKNPYVLDRSPCGSSSGTGAAIAASLAAVGVGTETDGSVICPASQNGLVGLKPSIGLISRTHVIPITFTQDTLGPMGRNVRDVALLFSVLIGSDPTDSTTKDADRYHKDYAADLSTDALRGVRLGILHPAHVSPAVDERYDNALARLRAAGAELIDVKIPATEGMREAELEAMEYEFKDGLNAYLSSTPSSVTIRTVRELIAFDKANAPRELGLFGQAILEAADTLEGVGSARYRGLRAKALAMAKDAGLDVMLAGVSALVAPSYPTAIISDPATPNAFANYGTSSMPAIAGYPHLTVPMGLVKGLPVGLSFIGAAFSDGDLLRYGYAFEATGALREPPHYLSHVPVGDLLEPYSRHHVARKTNSPSL